MAAAAAAIGPVATMFFNVFGAVNGGISLLLAPVFLTSASQSLKAMSPSKHEVAMRFWMGRGEIHDLLGGPIPSTALWNSVGQRLGSARQHGHSIKPGEYYDYKVMTPGTSERPAYVAVAAQNSDPICFAGMAMIFADASQPAVILGDVLALSNLMPWYQTLNHIGDIPDKYPMCAWIAGPNGKPSKDASVPRTNNTGARLPAGFSLHIDSFTGAAVNQNATDQRNKNPSIAYGNPARFWLFEDMRGHFDIWVFKNLPLPKGENGTDIDDFVNLPVQRSEPLKSKIAKRQEEDGPEEEEEAVLAKRNLLLDGTLVKGEQSGEALCRSNTSWGPDWYSYEHNHLCHMATKRLLPACSADVAGDCFDVEKHEIRPMACAPGRRCARDAGIQQKSYQRIEDSRNATSRHYF